MRLKKKLVLPFYKYHNTSPTVSHNPRDTSYMLSLYINNRLAHNSSLVRPGQKLTQLSLEVLNFVNKASVEYFPISLFDLCLTTVTLAVRGQIYFCEKEAGNQSRLKAESGWLLRSRGNAKMRGAEEMN